MGLFVRLDALANGLFNCFLWYGRLACIRFRLGRVYREDGATRSRGDLRQSVRNNFYNRSQRHLGVESSHITRLHPNAAVAGRATNQFFLGSSVNVNAPAEGVRV